MKFSCSREKLAQVLSVVADIIPTRPVKPVLQNIRIAGHEDGSVLFSATDLEVSVQIRFQPESMQDPGVVLVSGKRFAGLVRDDWSDEITVVAEDDRVEIVFSSGGKFHLFGNVEEEFPEIKVADTDAGLALGAGDVADAVNRSAFAAAKGDSRYALNGVYVKLEKETAEFVASDTHRLSIVRKKGKAKGVVDEKGAIVITRGVSLLSRMVSDGESVRLCLTDRELVAQTAMASMTASLVEGQFPRYQDVIPSDIKITVAVNREMFLRIIAQSTNVTNPENRSVVFTASGAGVQVRATGSEAGDGTMDMDAVIEGGEVEVNFNAAYVGEVLRVMSGETVTFQFKDDESPVRIDEGDFTHVIMPVMTK